MNCTQCGKETANPKFCSKSCSATFTNKVTPRRSTTRLCCVEDCNNRVKSHRHNRCASHWEDYKANASLNKSLGHYRNLSSVKHKHPSWANSHVRLQAKTMHKALTKLPCAHCGYSLHVELCHIRPVTDFPDDALMREVNHADNIVQLCRNCHWEFDNLPRS